MFFSTAGILMTGGSPGGKTGSPGDGGSTCNDCHGGSPQIQSGWISSNIPAGGYVEGTSYLITLTATQSGINKFGFECTAEDDFGEKVGTFGLLMPSETQLSNGGFSVSHTASGTFGAGSRTWQFSWVAPPSGTGNVTFFAAFNAANGNGGTSGDVIHLSSMQVTEAIPNTPPFFVSSPVLVASVGQTYLYDIIASDNEGLANLAITCPVLPVWLSFVDAGNGIASLTGTPQSTDIGNHTVELQLTDGTAAPISQVFQILVSQGLQTQEITLSQGWGLFSTYIAPVDSLIATVFSEIASNVSIVKDGDGLVFWPQFNVNAIVTMHIVKGYQINMISSDTLSVTGTAVVPENTPISIDQGWDIIAYLRQSSGSVITMMSPIVNAINIVKNGGGQVYWPQFTINSIVDMKPGEGYQINLTSSQILTYPAN